MGAEKTFWNLAGLAVGMYVVDKMVNPRRRRRRAAVKCKSCKKKTKR